MNIFWTQEELVIVTGGYNGLGGFNHLKSTEILVDSKTWIDGKKIFPMH